MSELGRIAYEAAARATGCAQPWSAANQAKWDAAAAAVMIAGNPGHAWIVGDASGRHWRTWGDFGPVWTTRRADALRFARREDAALFAGEDEDAWRIEAY